MNVDPSTNLVVFEIKGHGEPHVMSGRTRDEDCIRSAWLATPVTHCTAARKVSRIYSEWQPSVADAAFIQRTFPNAAVTYSFERPGPDGWDAAFAAAARTMAQADSEQEAERAAQNIQHVADLTGTAIATSRTRAICLCCGERDRWHPRRWPYRTSTNRCRRPLGTAA